MAISAPSNEARRIYYLAAEDRYVWKQRGQPDQPATAEEYARETGQTTAQAADTTELGQRTAASSPYSTGYDPGRANQPLSTDAPPGGAPAVSGPAGASTTGTAPINPAQPQSMVERLEAATPRYTATPGVTRASTPTQAAAPRGNMGGATSSMARATSSMGANDRGLGVTDPYARPGADPNASPGFASVDYSRFDQAASAYDRAESTFLSELDRLSGVDPFGNQAFLQKATDRAVAQARGSAAMTRGGAAAQAGAMRGAVGVQSQLAARGTEEQAIQRSRDQVASGQLRTQAATGLAGIAGDRAGNEVELAKTQTATMSQNLGAWLQKYGIDRQLAQSDVENLRNVALEYSRLSEDGRQANMDAIMTKYGIDKQTQVQLKQIAAGENITTGEFIMGTIGSIAGLAGGIATAPRGSRVNP